MSAPQDAVHVTAGETGFGDEGDIPTRRMMKAPYRWTCFN
jgi:hypothetical protein